MGSIGDGIQYITWNPSSVPLQNPAVVSLLSEALNDLVRQQRISRNPVRLCISDSLCVSRVAIGDKEEVDREIEQIRQRSQLYISLGLGQKLTGTFRTKHPAGGDYVLATIVNQSVLTHIVTACNSAHLSIEFIEPNAGSISRGIAEFGFKGNVPSLPVLQVTIRESRCDLNLAFDGRLMLSYSIAGFESLHSAGSQVASNMTRLRRFCSHHNLQGELNQVILFGDDHEVVQFQNGLLEKSKLTVLNNAESTAAHDSDRSNAAQSNAANDGNGSKVVRIALRSIAEFDASNESLLGPPDLIDQMKNLHGKSFVGRLARASWPSFVAVALVLCGFGYSWFRYAETKSKRLQLDLLLEEFADAEYELEHWETERERLRYYQAVESRLVMFDWRQLVGAVSRCLPENARLDSIALEDRETLILKGEMVEEDRTYEMLGALKRLPQIQKVTVEAIGAAKEQEAEKQHFDIRCALRSDQEGLRFVSKVKETHSNQVRPTQEKSKLY